MIFMGTVTEIRKSFIEWNGWGPPTSEYQIHEYCQANAENEEEADYAFSILLDWMEEK